MPSEISNIKIVTRLRPLSSEDDAKNVKAVVHSDGDEIKVSHEGEEASFSFENSYPATATNNVIYQSKVDDLVKRAFEGYNVCIMAFGATDSGKTYIMCGTDSDPGIMPLVNERVFQHINEKDDKEFLVSISFVDIMDKSLTDLLNPHTRDMLIRQHPYKSIYVEGLSEMVIHNHDDLKRLYEQGVRVRNAGVKDVDYHRQMSSAVFTITIEQRDRKRSRFSVRANICLVDLGGIESASSKIASNGIKSLLDVLSCLGNSKKKSSHIPYRNSSLTRLLQVIEQPSKRTDTYVYINALLKILLLDSVKSQPRFLRNRENAREPLGGNSFTLFLVTLSPLDKDRHETLQTLQYCQYAQTIKNTVRLNIDETCDIIAEMRTEISKLRQKITNSFESNRDEVLKLGELIKDLDIAKKQTWTEREKLSLQFEKERKINLTNKGLYEWVVNQVTSGTRALREKTILLQKEKDQLVIKCNDKRSEVDGLKNKLQALITDYSKLTESGKLNESATNKRLSAIHKTKESLKRESDALKRLKQQLNDVEGKLVSETEGAQANISTLKANSGLRQHVEVKEREEMEQRNKALISEEIERMKVETETEKADIQIRAAEGRQYSSQEGSELESCLIQLKAEMTVVSLELQIQKQEKDQMKVDLNNLYKVQYDELEIQQLQHFQTFRQYREMFEEQKHAIEVRFRHMLEDSIQDAVFLSSRNDQLVSDNQALQLKLAEMKDTVCRLDAGSTA